MKWIKTNWKLFIKHFADSMALLSTLATIVIGICTSINKPWLWGSCLVVSIIYAIRKIYPSEKTEIELSPKRKVSIKKGDIFKIEKGIIVIPVNNYFDTQIKHDVVSASSVHGLFVQHYKSKYPNDNLDKDIEDAINNDRLQAIGHKSERKNVHNGKLDSYELGSIVRLQKGDIQYYLVVATEFDDDNHVKHQPEKFSLMLLNMLKNIDTFNSGHPIYMPIVGSGQSGYNLSKQETLRYILHCIKLAEHYTTLGGTTIIVHENDMKEISLNKISYEFNLF